MRWRTRGAARCARLRIPSLHLDPHHYSLYVGARLGKRHILDYLPDLRQTLVAPSDNRTKIIRGPESGRGGVRQPADSTVELAGNREHSKPWLCETKLLKSPRSVLKLASNDAYRQNPPSLPMSSGFSQRLIDRLLWPLVRRLDRAHETHTARLISNQERHAFVMADFLIAQRRAQACLGLRDWEFRVCSQWGQDGIIQYLIDRVPIAQRAFVEFGVQNYHESSTRFLLMHDNWSGLIIDGDPDNIASIARESYHWQHDLTALNAFITRENINELLARRFTGDIGLLVVDIDGNDYWVWEAIEVVRPRIVVCEYNSVFGPERAVTMPYRPDFTRTAAHHSNLYFGASLAALHRLARKKGYVFAGCNSHGNDAFFVRADVARNVPEVTLAAGYVESKFRESRGPDGSLTHLSGSARFDAIAHLDVFDFADNTVRPLRDVKTG